MAEATFKIDKAEVIKKVKVETSYEYIPIIGEILGYWRKVSVYGAGEQIQVHLNHTLSEYDQLFVNGDEIKLKKEKYEFMECDTCRAKPGSPRLCSSCLHNREIISSM